MAPPPPLEPLPEPLPDPRPEPPEPPEPLPELWSEPPPEWPPPSDEPDLAADGVEVCAGVGVAVALSPPRGVAALGVVPSGLGVTTVALDGAAGPRTSTPLPQPARQAPTATLAVSAANRKAIGRTIALPVDLLILLMS